MCGGEGNCVMQEYSETQITARSVPEPRQKWAGLTLKSPECCVALLAKGGNAPWPVLPNTSTGEGTGVRTEGKGEVVSGSR